MDSNRPDRIILIDPSLCAGCRFAEFRWSSEAPTRKTIRCHRLDCDNWQRTDTDDGELLLIRQLLERSPFTSSG